MEKITNAFARGTTGLFTKKLPYPLQCRTHSPMQFSRHCALVAVIIAGLVPNGAQSQDSPTAPAHLLDSIELDPWTAAMWNMRLPRRCAPAPDPLEAFFPPARPGHTLLSPLELNRDLIEHLIQHGPMLAAAGTNTPPIVVELPPVTLPEVVVTPERRKKDRHLLPYSTGLVPLDTPRAAAHRALPAALGETPGIMLQKTGPAQWSPFLRGFTGFRTLMLIDGVRLNNSVFRDGPNQYWNTVDPLSIGRMEVLKGPASVLYGSDAIGGTVNALTRDPVVNRNRFGSARAYYRFASAEASHISRAEYSYTTEEGVGILAGTSWKEYGDLRGGNEVGRQPYTSFSEYDWDLKLIKPLANQASLTLGHYKVYQDDAWRTHKTIHGINWNGLANGNDIQRSFDQERHLTYLRYEADKLDSWIDAMKLTVSHHHQGEDEFRIKSSSAGYTKGFDVHSLGIALQLESDSAIGNWVYGAEYTHDFVDSYQDNFNASGAYTGSEIQGSIGDDSSYHLLGIFAQDTVKPGEWGEITIGGRYTYAALDANKVKDPETSARIGVSSDWHSAVGNLRALVHLDDEKRWNAFAGIAQGFRAPNLSDMTRFSTARSSEIEIPVTSLNPEHFITYETGVKARHGRFAGEAAYFYTQIDDMIIRTPTGGALIDGDNPVTKKNAGDGYLHGFELLATYRLDNQWTARGSFTWMAGKADTYPTSAPTLAREHISRLMPPTAQFALNWESATGNYWAEASTMIAGRQNKLNTRDKADTQRIPANGTPGFATFNLRAGWRPFAGASLFMGFENLLDEDYRIHGSGVNEPGRNFIVGAELTF